MNNSVTRCIFETLTMKTAALLLASLIFASFSGAASAHGLGEADIRNLAEAYGYVEYQKTAFTEIAHSYPALAPDVLRFQRRFRDRFPGAEAAVREHFACFGEFGVKVLAKSNERIGKLMPEVKFRTEDLAEKQLDLFKSTLDQPTEQTDRIFRTLSDVSFTHNPSEEFARNKETYSTKGNPKAQGLNIEISFPLSWVQKPKTVRPHVVSQWMKADEKTVLISAIGADENPDPALKENWTLPVLKEVVKSPDFWITFFPAVGEIVKTENARAMMLDSYPALLADATVKAERLGKVLYLHIDYLLFLVDNKVVNVQFTIGSEDLKTTEEAARKYRGLASLVFNSVYVRK